MIQRIQSVYLLLITALMAVLAIMKSEVIWWQSLVFAILGVISLVAIFLYKNRKRQMWIVAFLLLASILVFVYAIDISALIMGILSVVSMFLAVLAIRAIRKDEKLVRSADRLR